jgi:hypothetical protein
MTQAYNKRLGALREQGKEVQDLRQKASIVDRFANDPVYAREVIQQRAAQLGMPLAPNPSLSRAGAGAASGGVPENVLRAVQESIADDPALAFMAPSIAKAAWAVAQQAVQPLEQERQQQQRTQRQTEYATMTDALNAQAPGWDEYEEDMHARLQWLKSAVNGQGPMSHEKYGNVLELLYRWSSGMQFATGEAGKRMQKALLSKTTTGSAAPAKGPSTAELIAQATTPNDKWRIAFQAGVAEANNSR